MSAAPVVGWRSYPVSNRVAERSSCIFVAVLQSWDMRRVGVEDPRAPLVLAPTAKATEDWWSRVWAIPSASNVSKWELVHDDLLVTRLVRAAANRRGNQVIAARVVSKSRLAARLAARYCTATGRTAVRRSEAVVRDRSNPLKRDVTSSTCFGYLHQLLDESRQHRTAIDTRRSEVCTNW